MNEKLRITSFRATDKTRKWALALTASLFAVAPSFAAGGNTEDANMNKVQAVSQAKKTVSGTVYDTSGNPVIGATVTEVGTKNATVTDVDGKFTMSVANGARLRVSSVGYQEQTVSATGKSLSIMLKDDQETLDEVVVVAYGTQKKKDLTGSITAVDGKTIAVQAQSTVTRALEGSVPGLQAASLDGQPGLDVGIRIRGVGTASQNNSNALVIIDGAPAAEGVNVLASLNSRDIESVTVLKDAASTALYGSRGANGVILITTKKGKSGKAKITFEGRWGVNSLGANGKTSVIGQDDPAEYYEYAWGSIYNAVRYGYANGGSALSDSEARTFASQHLFDYNGSLTNFSRNYLGNWMLYNVPGAVYNTTSKGSTQSATMTGAYLVNENGRLNPNAELLYGSSSYRDELIESQFRQDYNLSASGASDKIDYFVSLGMLDDPSYVKWSKFKRYNGRANINAKVTNWLKTGAKFGYTHRNTESQATRWGRNPGAATQNIFYWINAMSPLRQFYARDEKGNYMYDANGEKVVHTKDSNGYGTTYSPLGPTQAVNYNLNKLMQQSSYTNKSNDFTMKGYVEATFLKDFTFTANISYDLYYQTQKRFYNTDSAAGFLGSSLGSAINKLKYEYSYLTLQQILNYGHDFGKHHVDAMVGHEYYEYNFDRLNYGSAHSLIDDFEGYVNFLGTASYSTFGSTYGGAMDKFAMESYFGRANYVYDDKYYASVSLRRDGSSKFKYASNRWGTFWSIGGGWRISSEKFMESTKDWLNNLKIRASYGVIGNQNGIGYYSGYQTWSYGGSNWTTGSTTYPQTVTLTKGNWVNDGLTWEKVHTFDVGIDFTLFNDKLTGTIDYYNKQTVNAIWSKPVSYLAAGQSSLTQNTAGIRNRGFELELSYNVINTKDWGLTLSTNGTHYNTIITKVPEGTGSDALNGCWTASADSWSMSGGGSSSGGEYLRGVGKDYYNLYMYKYGGVAGNPGKEYYSDSYVQNDESVKGKPLFYHKVDAADHSAGHFTDKEIGSDVLTTDYSLADKYEMGDALPEWIGGFSANLRYKDFDLSVIFSYQLGGKFYSVEYGNGLYLGSDNIGANISDELLGNTWTEDNVNAKFPMVVYGQTYNDGATIGSWAYTDLALFSASYLSLKNITLGYNVPKKLLKKIGVSNVRVFASADNCLMVYGHSGIDPRWSLVGGMEVGAYSYPYMSTYTLGINIDF